MWEIRPPLSSLDLPLEILVIVALSSANKEETNTQTYNQLAATDSIPVSCPRIQCVFVLVFSAWVWTSICLYKYLTVGEPRTQMPRVLGLRVYMFFLIKLGIRYLTAESYYDLLPILSLDIRSTYNRVAGKIAIANLGGPIKRKIKWEERKENKIFFNFLYVKNILGICGYIGWSFSDISTRIPNF